MAGGHILLAVMFLLTLGMIGWMLSGSLGAILLGLPGAVLLVAFTSFFLFPLKLLVAFLQAFIFCMLSMLYISAAVQEAEHH
jgi:F0F1-type ATP synthase membrane subunit a